MTPYPHQIEIAKEGYGILKRYGLVYFAMQERTGKTLASILVCEKTNRSKILVLTTKKALKGWEDTLAKFKHSKEYLVINYESLHKIKFDSDLVIIDEAHTKVASFPAMSETFKKVYAHTKGKPLIYLSATPSAQSYSQLYHQFKLSLWSPFKEYKGFHSWFNTFGIPSTVRVAGGRLVPSYTETKKDLVEEATKHLFISYTRKQLGFKEEPQDKKIYLPLSETTKDIYNTLQKKKVITINGEIYAADTITKLKVALHQIEGGTLKLNDTKSIFIGNKEKIEYILSTYGDIEDLVIMYHFKEEFKLLKEHFKKATILQASSYAEGVDLSMYKYLIIYSMDYSTSKYSQRRARQANKERTEEIVVRYLLVKDAISDQVYTTVVENNTNYVDRYYVRKQLD